LAAEGRNQISKKRTKQPEEHNEQANQSRRAFINTAIQRQLAVKLPTKPHDDNDRDPDRD
jgi:hypothetical protein